MTFTPLEAVLGSVIAFVIGILATVPFVRKVEKDSLVRDSKLELEYRQADNNLFSKLGTNITGIQTSFYDKLEVIEKERSGQYTDITNRLSSIESLLQK